MCNDICTSSGEASEPRLSRVEFAWRIYVAVYCVVLGLVLCATSLIIVWGGVNPYVLSFGTSADTVISMVIFIAILTPCALVVAFFLWWVSVLVSAVAILSIPIYLSLYIGIMLGYLNTPEILYFGFWGGLGISVISTIVGALNTSVNVFILNGCH